MARITTIFILLALVAGLQTGCTWHGKSGGCENARMESKPVPPAEPASQPGDDTIARGKLYKSSTDDGLEAIEAPPGPIFKNRSFGELTQVTFTRVGGDDGVAVSPTEDLIAFASDRHTRYHNIYVKTVAGAVVTQKTSASFDEIQPAFSPDGRKIAYASNRNGNYDVWIIDAHANGAAVQVTFGDEDDLHPSWMPDGNSIIYSSYSTRTGDWAIMQTFIKTGEVRDLGPGKFPTVSPDGKKILFQRARQRDGFWYSIWTMNTDGTEQTEIVVSADWAAINPCWSPDGQFIAFATVNKSPEARLEDRVWRGDDIYVVSANGRELVQITADTAPDWEPTWSGRDGRIYFVSERNGFRNIWSVKPPVYYLVASEPSTVETAAR